MNIAINGFGRIGRLLFKELYTRESVNIVAINDLSSIDTLAHLLKYDTSYGIFQHDILKEGENLIIGDHKIRIYSDKSPEDLPWKELDVDVVVECTGVFRTKELAQKHIDAGAKRILLSAPPKSEGFNTIVIGVNDEEIDPNAKFYSNASCTTNCLAPQIKLIDEVWGIDYALMTTTHSITSSQNLQDGAHKDLRRARAASHNIIPTTTGAAIATSMVYPKIKGRLEAMAIRVPVLVGSLTETTFTLKEETTESEINQLFKDAALSHDDIIQYVEAPIVSSDIIGNRHSCIIDSLLTKKHGNLYKVIAWYDNEAGYSARLADLAIRIAQL